jgi:G3E family GTPase
MNDPIEFIVLTGFLGSGKTTLLTEFLTTQAAADTAIIVNEVGEIGLDGAILAESGSDVPMAMLANGCICCRMGSDLATTVHSLIEAERPGASGLIKRIIIETSGLSKPGPILRQLADLAFLRMRVAVIATFDAIRGTAAESFEEAAAQWAAASRIVVTKLDVASPEQAAAAADIVRSVNPLADVVVEADRAEAIRRAFDTLALPTVPHWPASTSLLEHNRIAVRLLGPVDTPTYDVLANWLDNLSGTLGERLLRVKGIVRVADLDRPLLIQSVGTLFSEPRPIGSANTPAVSFLVIIARDLNPGELESVQPVDTFITKRQAPTTRSLQFRA